MSSHAATAAPTVSAFATRAGQRQGPAGVVPIHFKLVLRADRRGFDLGAHLALIELADPAIVLDASRSNAAESVYLLDRTDPAAHFRRVSSLVLNLTRGDVRLFHHHWIPPAEWQDSDQYLYSGHCRKL